MNWIRENKAIAGGIGVVGLAVLAFLAFGVFGIHTEFFDDEVAEDGPAFDSGAVSVIPSDVVDDATTDDELQAAHEALRQAVETIREYHQAHGGEHGAASDRHWVH